MVHISKGMLSKKEFAALFQKIRWNKPDKVRSPIMFADGGYLTAGEIVLIRRESWVWISDTDLRMETSYKILILDGSGFLLATQNLTHPPAPSGNKFSRFEAAIAEACKELDQDDDYQAEKDIWRANNIRSQLIKFISDAPSIKTKGRL